ncbi:MAG: SRPBCC domain-containing protein [Ktedonobacterales bacterium]|nr:SRPBCC domain-containing protein [Ktedonobacterales bacterium]
MGTVEGEPPPLPGVRDVSANPARLQLLVEIPHADIATLFTCWIEPARLRAWWPTAAETDPHLGGAYHLSWPVRGWHPRGRYTVFDAPQRLAFT